MLRAGWHGIVRDLRGAVEFRLSGGVEEIATCLQCTKLEMSTVVELLEMALFLCKTDEDSAFDFAAAGGHFGICRYFDSDEKVQSLAYQVAASSGFPSPVLSMRRPPPEKVVIGEREIWVRYVAEQKQSAQCDTGFAIWPAARLLATVVPGFAAGSEVLEIGAGVGLVGLACCDVASKVTLTDCNAICLRTLEYNVRLNRWSRKAAVRFLDFGDLDHPIVQYPRIVASDVVCCDHDAIILAQALRALLQHDGKALLCLASARNRYGVQTLPKALEASMLRYTRHSATLDQAARAGLEDEAEYLSWDFYYVEHAPSQRCSERTGLEV